MVFGFFMKFFRKRVKPPVDLFDEKQKESDRKKSSSDVKKSDRKKSSSDIKELLKLVTQQKKKDLPLAISTLKGIYELDKKEKVLTLKQHLRLYPLLQKNGQKEEAFQEFTRLFTSGYPRQGNKPIEPTKNLPASAFDPEVYIADYIAQFKALSEMHEEMAKFYITEKNKDEIVPHFILSQLYDLRYQAWVSKIRDRIDPKLVEMLDSRVDDSPESSRSIYEAGWASHDVIWVHMESENIRVMERRTNNDRLVKLLTPILKKSGQLGLIEEILNIFKKHIKILPTIETQKVFDDLSSLKQ